MLWKIVISVVAVEVLVENLALVEAVACYKCKNCVELTDFGIEEQCEDTCAIWKNLSNETSRGCKPNDDEAELIIYECSDDLCNGVECQQCSNLENCHRAFCKINKESDDGICYISKTDESRNCTSGLPSGYNKGDYEFCNSENCNRVAICVECNSNDQLTCLDNFELGCTSKLPSPELEETKEFKKCSGDNCNEEEFMRCYSCFGENCKLINPEETVIDCVNDDSLCYTGIDGDGDFYRGCLEDLNTDGFEFLSTCEEPLCNQHVFPPLGCFQCTEDCGTLSDPEYCTNMDAEYCFTLEAEDGALIHGCHKDNLAQECQEQINCRKCDTYGCNQAEPPLAQCISCASTQECKNPETVNCEFYEDCFIKYDGTELTKGCSNQLTSIDERTIFCDQPSCNEHHCVRCDSETLDDCVAGQGNVEYESCPTGKCIVFVNDKGFTVRGCETRFSEQNCPTETCKKTDGPGSNDEPFPANNLQCYHCTGLGCDIESSTEIKYCPNNNIQGCFIKFDGDTVIERGCITEKKECDEDPTCYSCTKKKICNNREQLLECKSCTFTSAEEDCLEDPTKVCKTIEGCVTRIDDNDNSIVRDCVENVPECQDGSCESHGTNDQNVCMDGSEGETRLKVCESSENTDKCYTGIKDGQVIKGCIKDLEFEDGVTACDGALCNLEWSCYQCLTENGKDCLNDKDKHCETERGCVTLLDGANVIRDCFENHCNDDPSACENVCFTEFCNNEPVCYACEDCDTVEDQQLEMCSQLDCYSAQNLDTKTISRGCFDEATKQEECQPDFNCIVCNKTMCNDHKPLQEPLKCSKCDLGSCGDYAPAKSCDSIGLLIDRCVVYAPLGVTIYKGCLSGIDKAVKDICQGTKDCNFCNQNYCNTEELSCHQCSTKTESFGCLENPLDSFECSPGDSCTTCLDTEGHLHRGCFNDLVGICSGSQNVMCQYPNCNNNTFPTDRHQCYQCDDCLTIKETDYKPCLLYKDTESCYVQVVDEHTVHRGCTSGAPEPCTNCENCEANGCNSMEPFQANELSCVTCISNADCEGRAFGDRCEKEVLIGRTDACYTQLVGKLVIQKGCLSDLELSNPFYDDCLRNNGNCSTCATDNCNKGKAWCYSCNSEEDPDCSDSAYLASYRVECEAECVTKLDEQGFTVRGCIEDFDDFNRESCEASGHCQVCEGKICNTATLPADGFQSCYQCEGSDSSCLEATMPAMMKACRKYVPGDQCYTYAENATWIARGCLSDLEQSCDAPCLVCKGKGCNREAVLQKNTLDCVSCEGAACKGEKEGPRCTEQVLLGRQDSCYEYNDGQTIRKGCLSDLEKVEDSDVKKSCESGNSESCKLCDYNNCNGDHHYCVSCSSDKDLNCAGRMSSVPPELLEDCDESKCVSKFEGINTIIKGCASASKPCQEDDPKCSECEGSLCNNIPFPVDRILCHQCTACNILATEATICARYDPEESCYTRLIGDTIERGCLSDVALQDCDDLCYTCTINGCNNEPDQYVSELSCVHCQGGIQCLEVTLEQSKPCQSSITFGETDKCYTLRTNGEVLERGCLANQKTNCGGLPFCEEETCECNNCNLVDREKQITCHQCEGKDCGQAVTIEQTCTGAACVSYVSRDGLVSRGCLQDYETLCSVYGNQHSLCVGDRCNGEVYPAGRMTCYQCENCASTDMEQSRICPRYVQQDGCYTMTDGTNVKRGCLSDLPQLECSGKNCESCNDADCNSKEIMTPTDEPEPGTTPEEGTTAEDGTTPDEGTTSVAGTTTTVSTPTTELPFQSCIICSETASEDRCAWGFKPSAAVACPPLNDADFGCFSCRKNALAVRGCKADLDETSCDEEEFTECPGTGCNSISFLQQQCAFCTRDCDGSRASFTVQVCAGNVEYESRGCYLLRNARRLITERGCFADLSEEQRADCLRDGDACVRCTGDVCNGGTVKRAFWVGIVGALTLALLRTW